MSKDWGCLNGVDRRVYCNKWLADCTSSSFYHLVRGSAFLISY